MYAVEGLPDDFQPFSSDAPSQDGQPQNSMHPLGGYAVQGVNDGYAEGAYAGEGGYDQNAYGETNSFTGSYADGGYSTDQTVPNGQDAYGSSTSNNMYGNANGYYSQDYSYSQQPTDQMYGYDQTQHDGTYKQETSIGQDALGATAVSVSSAPIPNPSQPSAPVTTVSSGVGPTYVPDGADQFGGTYSAVPVVTKLFASYTWVVQGFHQVTDEKLVSPPFGPADWRWQLVLYPKGAGDGTGTHVSGFLRPLRSESELVAGDEWQRPVKEFSFRVRRAVPGSPQIASIGSSPDITDEFLVTDTSDPTNFTGFSASLSGWGFPELLELSSLNEAVTYDGTFIIEADVIGDQTVDWAMYQYQWDIPSFLQLTEDETLSQPFGTVDCQWRLKIFRQGDKDGQGTHLSAYLIPERSDKDVALGSVWSRPIVSLTIKIWTNDPNEVLVSKTLTGGYLFSSENLTSGWSQLYELSQLNEVLDWYGTLCLQAEVVWNPMFANPSTQLGKARDSLSSISTEVPHLRRAVEALREELDTSKAEIVNLSASLSAAHNELALLQSTHSQSQQEITNLQSHLTEARNDCESLREGLAGAEARIKGLKSLEGKYAVAQKDLQEARVRLEEKEGYKEQLGRARVELQGVRNVQDEVGKLRAVVARVKGRIAGIRAGMEEGGVVPVEGDGDEEVGGEDLKARWLQSRAELEKIKAELVETREELEQKSRAMTDAAIFSAREIDRTGTEPSYTEEGQTLLHTALQSVKNELLVAQTVLEDTNLPPTETERAALSAEVAMVMAELDVARATLVEAVSNIPEGAQLEDEELVEELERVKGELSTVRAQLTAARTALDDGFGAMDAGILSSGARTPESSGGVRGGFEVVTEAHGGLRDVGVSSMSLGGWVDDAARALRESVPPPPLASGGGGVQGLHGQERDAELEELRGRLAEAEAELTDMKQRMVA
ncbi:hypothetical protein HK097_006350, partial [Rhizophlyctis rosea]